MKTRFFRFAVLAASTLGGGAVAETFMGAQLPDGAANVGEQRFRAPQDYKKTLTYYRSVYPPGNTFVWKSIANTPDVKAMHIAMPPGRGFTGLNIYETKDETRIFVLAAPPGKAVKKKPPATKPAKKR